MPVYWKLNRATTEVFVSTLWLQKPTTGCSLTDSAINSNRLISPFIKFINFKTALDTIYRTNMIIYFSDLWYP